jgi:hypothetical protein
MERFDAAGVALSERPHHFGRPRRRENTMRYWKKLVAGGAAMLISAGAAHAGQEPSAVEQSLRGMTSTQQETSWDAKGGAASDPARVKADAAVKGIGAGYVTHDELDTFTKDLTERVERELNPPRPAPTFTDAG